MTTVIYTVCAAGKLSVGYDGVWMMYAGSGYKSIHVHPAGMYAVFWKTCRNDIWYPVGDYVQDDFGNLVEV